MRAFDRPTVRVARDNNSVSVIQPYAFEIPVLRVIHNHTEDVPTVTISDEPGSVLATNEDFDPAFAYEFLVGKYANADKDKDVVREAYPRGPRDIEEGDAEGDEAEGVKSPDGTTVPKANEGGGGSALVDKAKASAKAAREAAENENGGTKKAPAKKAAKRA